MLNVSVLINTVSPPNTELKIIKKVENPDENVNALEPYGNKNP